MPIFLRLNTKKTAIIKRAIIATFLILLGVAFSEQFLFRFFNISVDSFRIVGDEAIFFVIGFDMLNARLPNIKPKETDLKQYARNIAITPLAIPMLCGPGAITNTIVLMEDTGLSC